MHDVRIGDRVLTPLSVRLLSEEEWSQAKQSNRATEHDHLFFLVGGQVYDAAFDKGTKLTSAIHAAIAKGELRVEYDGKRAQFLMSEDRESASLLEPKS